MEKTLFMKNIKIFYAWLNYKLSFWTHNNKPYYQLKLWYEYQNLKLINENENKQVTYTHTLKQAEL